MCILCHILLNCACEDSINALQKFPHITSKDFSLHPNRSWHSRHYYQNFKADISCAAKLERKNIRMQKRNPSNLELNLILDLTHCWCNHVWFLRVLRTLSALWTMLEPSSNFLRRTLRGWSCAPQGVEGNRSSVMMKHLDIRRNPFPVSVITWLLTVLWKKRAK